MPLPLSPSSLRHSLRRRLTPLGCLGPSACLQAQGLAQPLAYVMAVSLGVAAYHVAAAVSACPPACPPVCLGSFHQ